MNSNNMDSLLEMLRGEFIDEAEDNLNAAEIMLENLRSGIVESEEAMQRIRRVAHSLKGSSGVAEFPLVTVIMHRLEDYLSDVPDLDGQHIDNVQVYLDKARQYSVISVDQKSVNTSDLVRSLPNIHQSAGDISSAGEVGKEGIDIIEVMLISNERISTKLFERELRAAGLRVTTMRSPFEALEMVVRTRPDMVLVSGVLDVMSGVDVSCALRSMPVTKDIPVAVLTSFDRDHHDLEGLRDDVDIVNKSHLKDDLLRALEHAGLIN